MITIKGGGEIMRESTGELSMVVITIIIVIALVTVWNFAGPYLTNWVLGVFNNATHTTTNELT